MWQAPEGCSPDLKYPSDTGLMAELRARASEYFEGSGRARDGGWRIILKTFAIFAWTVGSYVGLVFFASTWWQVILLAIALALALAAIGFSIQHDGGHGAFSRNRKVSAMAAASLDLIGGSSYMWNQKHNILHHTYPNVVGADDDISQAPWLRLCRGDELLPVHRYQHIYSWLLYTIVPPKWMLVDDLRRIRTQRAGNRYVPPPKGRALELLLLGKAFAFTWWFVIPFAVHGFSLALVGTYLLIFFVWGNTLSMTFQLAHCNDAAEFTPWPREGSSLSDSWAEQQLATTVNFSRGNSIVSWYTGGLNHQIEHHLFPRVCHVHYPALSKIVREVCERRGVAYRDHGSVFSALRSHVVHLRRMGEVA